MTARPVSRLAAFGLALAFVVFCLVVKLLPWFGLACLSMAIRDPVAGAVALTGAMAATWWLRKRKPAWLSPELVLLGRPTLQGWLRGLGATLVGGALFGSVFAVTMLLGGIDVQWKGLDGSTLGAMVALLTVSTLCNAAWEEYTFRGWAFSVCVRSFGPHGVAVVLGAAFGALHILNPHASVAAVLSVSLAGWLLAYVMLAFRSIVVPIGLHVGWNLVQSLLTSNKFWELARHENELLSGGPYGLEASIAGVSVTALAAVAAFILFVRRGLAARPQPGP